MATQEPKTEYESDPRLALLAQELQLLNNHLIAEQVPDNVRIARLRLFAEQSKKATHIACDSSGTPIMGEDMSRDKLWTIIFRGAQLGHFDNAAQARAAFREAHIAFYGTKSRYHPSQLNLDSKYVKQIGREVKRHLADEAARKKQAARQRTPSQ